MRKASRSALMGDVVALLLWLMLFVVVSAQALGSLFFEEE
jgi:hypothetical protein